MPLPKACWDAGPRRVTGMEPPGGMTALTGCACGIENWSIGVCVCVCVCVRVCACHTAAEGLLGCGATTQGGCTELPGEITALAGYACVSVCLCA